MLDAKTTPVARGDPPRSQVFFLTVIDPRRALFRRTVGRASKHGSPLERTTSVFPNFPPGQVHPRAVGAKTAESRPYRPAVAAGASGRGDSAIAAPGATAATTTNSPGIR